MIWICCVYKELITCYASDFGSIAIFLLLVLVPVSTLRLKLHALTWQCFTLLPCLAVLCMVECD